MKENIKQKCPHIEEIKNFAPNTLNAAQSRAPSGCPTISNSTQNVYIKTGTRVSDSDKWKQKRPPFYLETIRAGVFAAGDVRSDSVKRIASAVGEGSMAVRFVHEYLEEISLE